MSRRPRCEQRRVFCCSWHLRISDGFGVVPGSKTTASSLQTSKTTASSLEAPADGGDNSVVPATSKIIELTRAEVHRLYCFKGILMDSAHQGVSVLLATRVADGVDVVIKTREKSKSFRNATDEREWRYTTEVQLNMTRIDTICQYLEVLETSDSYYVVMERVEGRDLCEHFRQENIPYEDARVIIWQILEALSAFHAQGRIHKDLKFENVVVDISPYSITSKLIDFDTVQDWEPSSLAAKYVIGTNRYIAPEAYSGEYSPKSDIYSVGVIMYRLLTGYYPIRAAIFNDKPGENEVGNPVMIRIQKILRRTKINFQRPPFDECPEAADLVQRMLAIDSHDRPSAEDALGHPWFEERLFDPSP